MQQERETSPIHQLIFAVYPIVFLVTYNRWLEVSVAGWQILFTLIASLVTAVLCYLSLARLLQSRIKAALITSVMLCVFFSYGHVAMKVERLITLRLPKTSLRPLVEFLAHHDVRPHHISNVAYLLFTIVGIWSLVVTHRRLNNLTRVLNFAAIVLVCIPISGFAYQRFIERSYNLPGRPVKPIPAVMAGQDVKPDIYFIVLDMYPSRTVLHREFGFDNSNFLEQLRQRGFYVTENAYSHYPGTVLSVPSTLNMCYFDDLGEQLEQYPPSIRQNKCYELLYEQTNRPKVIDRLRREGYQYVLYSSGYGLSRDNPLADIVYHDPGHSRFLSLLENTTLMAARFSGGGGLGAKQKRQLLLSQFQRLATSSQESATAPRFHFAHFLCPHEPYVVEQSGELLRSEDLRLRSGETEIDREKRLFLGQLQFANTMTLQALDEILVHAKPPPVIILQADHGPPFLPESSYATDKKRFLRERFSILNAMHLPDLDTATLPPDLSPVNTFRVVLNHYFGHNEPMLPDRHFYVKDWNWQQPWRLEEVTEHLGDTRAAATVASQPTTVESLQR